jgi:hypothetical protein
MVVKQIYDIVNSVNKQTMGLTDLTVVDEQGLISLGQTVLTTNGLADSWLNSLAQRIGRTIISFREYKSKYSDMVLDSMQWGNIVQKIKVSMPEATEDESYNLVEGQSIDMYKVANPTVTQSFFTSETPYQFYVTVKRKQLQEAFTSENSMNGFIGAIYGEVQNAIELSLESLARNCINNFIGEKVHNEKQINLLAMYNTETNKKLTVNTCLHDKEFLAYCVSRINLYSKYMENMSTEFNDGIQTRHTPKSLQHLRVLEDFESRLETVVQYQAFRDNYVKLNNYHTTSFWQSIKKPSEINVNISSDGTAVKYSGILAVLYDRDALGLYKKDSWTSTTPFNSAGGYYNTYYHHKELYFNDLSENFVVFVIADA